MTTTTEKKAATMTTTTAEQATAEAVTGRSNRRSRRLGYSAT